MTSSRFVVGALGDSITTAFNAFKPADNWAHSWSTGLQEDGAVTSHAARLRRLFPTLTVETRNVAASGARVAALPEQARRLATFKPDYATVLVGANDLTSWTGSTAALVAHYTGALETAVSELVTASPRVLILAVGIPNQAHLIELGKFAQYLQYVDPIILHGLRRAYAERWEALNGALAELARRRAANVRFASGVALTKFGAEHLSTIDSYHPSLAGQALLADLAWKEGHFPG